MLQGTRVDKNARLTGHRYTQNAKKEQLPLFLTHDAKQIRTADTTVKGWCLNRLTMAPQKGEDRIRTGDQGVADPRLTTWLLRHILKTYQVIWNLDSNV